VGCRFGLSGAPQKQFSGRASGRLFFSCFLEFDRFFRQPLFKGRIVFDAASLCHGALSSQPMG